MKIIFDSNCITTISVWSTNWTLRKLVEYAATATIKNPQNNDVSAPAATVVQLSRRVCYMKTVVSIICFPHPLWTFVTHYGMS